MQGGSYCCYKTADFCPWPEPAIFDWPMTGTQPPSGHFSLLYFASAATYTKKASEFLPGPSCPRRLFEELETRYPGIKAKVLDSSALTVNLEYVDVDEADESIIKPGDEVAIIPPVSSG